MPRLIAVTADLSLVTAHGSAITRTAKTAWTATVPGFIDAALVGTEAWVAASPGSGDARLHRIGQDGTRLGDVALPGTITNGRWLTSAFVRAAVWQGDVPWAVREDGAVPLPEAPGAPGAYIAAPVMEGRWLLWRAGHATLWRATREAWRVPVADASATLVDVAALLDARLVALCVRERLGEELRLIVLSTRDGSISSSLRLTGTRRIRFAPRRGTALVHVGEQLIAVDLRFGRVLREIAVGRWLHDFVVDETMQAIGFLGADGVGAARYADFEHGLAGPEPVHSGQVASGAIAPAGHGAGHAPATTVRSLRDESGTVANAMVNAAQDTALIPGAVASTTTGYEPHSDLHRRGVSATTDEAHPDLRRRAVPATTDEAHPDLHRRGVSATTDEVHSDLEWRAASPHADSDLRPASAALGHEAHSDLEWRVASATTGLRASAIADLEACAASADLADLTGATDPAAAWAGSPSDAGHVAVMPVVAESPAAMFSEPAVAPPPSEGALGRGPLWALGPHEEWPLAGALEARRALEARLDLLGARLWSAIAGAWDSGRISQPDSREPPFAAEVVGILRRGSGRAPEQVAASRLQVAELELAVAAIDVARGKRLIPIEVLGRQFGLSPLAVQILLVVAGPHLRGDYARLYGVLNNDPARALCDELLVCHILGPDKTDAIARELERDRPLRRYGLVAVAADAPSRVFAALTVDPMVVRIMRGGSLDVDSDPHLRPRVADRALDQVRVPRALIHDAMTALAVAHDAPARIVVRGRTGSGRRTLLAALAAQAGRALGVIDLAGAPRDPARLLDLLRASLRRALMRGWIPCVDGLELIADDDATLRDGQATILRDHPGPLALRLPPFARAPLDPGYLALDLPVLDEHERFSVWQDALARRGLAAADAAELAARYRIGPGVIERVTASVGEAMAATRDAAADGGAATAAVNTGVRQHLESRIGDVATRVGRQATWSDVVLPEDLVDSLLEITGRVRYRKKVFEDWGYGRAITTSRGITALFSGGPGTGKTMVAGVIARDLGVELYRVDVSRITSKWIGETEKNLGALFDAAEDGQVMLLFDEADSLFAKRTNVQTSVDRYANMEVNYLLQRLDSFEGIAILTTNFGTAIDPAFRRRLSFRVTFPFPDEEMRERLWRALIPAEVPRAEDIDFASLAARFKLSGGYIRNASLRAAFLAAEEGMALTHDHIERAIRAEFREIGKLADTGMLE